VLLVVVVVRRRGVGMDIHDASTAARAGMNWLA
jgi:hypothetical protein